MSNVMPEDEESSTATEMVELAVREGNREYQRRNFEDALSSFEKAVELSPCDAHYRCSRAAALAGLGRIFEAMEAYQEALKLDPKHKITHWHLGYLFIRLGQVEYAQKDLCFRGKLLYWEEIRKLQWVVEHLINCTNARKFSDWERVLEEADAAIRVGADYSAQVKLTESEEKNSREVAELVPFT